MVQTSLFSIITTKHRLFSRRCLDWNIQNCEVLGVPNDSLSLKDGAKVQKNIYSRKFFCEKFNIFVLLYKFV